MGIGDLGMLKNSKAFSGFSVDSLESAKKFYGIILGVVVEEKLMGLELKLAGGNNVFIYPKENHEPAAYTVLNFPVEDIDEVVDDLVGKGVKFEKYEGMHQDERGIAHSLSANMGRDIAWFKDPAGNILSVIQQK